MFRLILIFIVGILVAVGALAVALYHFLGVKGLIIFPFVILALLWAAKWFIKNLVKRFVLSLFGMKARALRGATMNVHSIRVIPEPESKGEEEDGDEDEDKKNAEPGEPKGGNENEDDDEDDKNAAVVSVEKKEPRDYVELDVTITPKSANSFWEPTELLLASEKIRSLADLEEKTIGDVQSVEIWDGSAFGPDDSDKYPGVQRIKFVFAVKPGSKSGWLCYYHEAIGELALPVGTVEV